MIDVTGLRPRRPAAPRSLREQQQLQLLLDAVAGAVYAAGALAILARHLVSPGVTVLGVVLVVAAAALARQRPVLAVAVAVAVLWLAPLDDGLAWLGAPALAYAAFRAAERSPARIGAAALAVALTGPAATALPSFRHAGGVLPFGLLIVAAWAIGTAVLRRRQEQEQRLHAHVADERLRIARELHDVVAHSISAITVQAGYARLTLERDSARTVEALEAIESTGRHTLDELRTLLGVLRTAPPLVPSLRPAPTLADLPALLEQATCLRPRPGSATQTEEVAPAGPEVDLVVIGDPRPLPAGLELAAYRIAQEALTNVVRHSDAAHAVVQVEYGRDALRIRVRDHGPDPRPPTGAGHRAAEQVGVRVGHGIIGMRERAALYGGDITAGPAADGGFEVLAVLPLQATGRPALT